MNYVQHTRAAHEMLLAQPTSRPHHFSLYWALFRQWNAERFPAALQVQRRELMQTARIGSRDTYTAALRDLETWGLLGYQPTHDSTQGTRILLVDLGAEVSPKPGQPRPAGRPESGPTQTGEVGLEVGQPVGLLPGQPSPEVAPEVGQPSLYSKTVDVNYVVVNGDDAPQKKEAEVFAGDGLAKAQVLPPDDLQLPPAGAPKAKVARKGKGVPAPPPRPEPHRRPLPEVPFRESAYYDLATFTAAFEGTDYALADLRHYHQLIDTWRDRKTGLPPRRKDWLATAKRFMLNDANDNRLKLAPHVQPYRPGPTGADPGTRAAGTGYRSKYDA